MRRWGAEVGVWRWGDGGAEVRVKEVEKEEVRVGRCGGKSQAGEAEKTVNQGKQSFYLASNKGRLHLTLVFITPQTGDKTDADL